MEGLGCVVFCVLVVLFGLSVDEFVGGVDIGGSGEVEELDCVEFCVLVILFGLSVDEFDDWEVLEEA